MKRLFLFATLVAAPALAQSFEAASIKPSDGRLGIDMKTYPGGRVVATDVTLGQLIGAVYQVDAYKIVGGPAWLGQDRFDISATAGPGFVDDKDLLKALGRPASRNVIELLGNLLAERFGLKVHREQRPDTIYNLVQAKGGSKLAPAKEDQERAIITTFRDSLDGVVFNGSIGHRASMKMLANEIEQRLKHPVFDKTGLDGLYDFRFDYAYDSNNPGERPPYISAVQEKLGLKLEPEKGMSEFLVVDSASKPTPN